MKNTIGLNFDGRSPLVRLTPFAARNWVSRLFDTNGLTKHELTQFEVPGTEPTLVERLFWKRSPTPIAKRELRWIEHLSSLRVCSGAWRVHRDEGHLCETTLHTDSARNNRHTARYVPLYGALFLVEALRKNTLLQSGPRDVLVQFRSRSWRFLRFEGVQRSRREEGLELLFRNRLHLDTEVPMSLHSDSEASILQYFQVTQVLAQKEFHLLAPPRLLGS